MTRAAFVFRKERPKRRPSRRGKFFEKRLDRSEGVCYITHMVS